MRDRSIAGWKAKSKFSSAKRPSAEGRFGARQLQCSTQNGGGQFFVTPRGQFLMSLNNLRIPDVFFGSQDYQRRMLLRLLGG